MDLTSFAQILHAAKWIGGGVMGIYVATCVLCHGVPGVDRGGNIPNLGYSHTEVINNLEAYVFGGAAKDRGMPDFTGRLKPEDIPKLKAFIQGVPDAIRPK